MILQWTVVILGLVVAMVLVLLIRGRVNESRLNRFLRFLRRDANHKIVTLTVAELGQWNARSRLTRRQFRSLSASEAAQEAVDSGARSLILVSPDNKVLLIAHEMEDHNWGFLELPRSSDLATDDLFLSDPEHTPRAGMDRTEMNHAASDVGPPPPKKGARNSTGHKRSIFLSHSHRDKDVTRQLYHELRGNDIACWFDEAEIRPGESIIAKIEQAIDQFDYVGVVLTPNSVGSEWVKTELRMALTDEITSAKLRVIGLLLQDCELPGFLRDKLYIDFRPSFRDGVVRLITCLRGEVSCPKIPLQGRLADFVENCGESLWAEIGAHCNQQSVADLIRSTRREELLFILEVAKHWQGYKQWGDQLERKARLVAKADTSTARRLVRKIMDLGLIEPANDMEYPRRGGLWAYASTPMLIAFRNFAGVAEVQHILREGT